MVYSFLSVVGTGCVFAELLGMMANAEYRRVHKLVLFPGTSSLPPLVRQSSMGAC